ncbi:aspartyl-phosphate phosphatase Spo0E family protein [Metabacillus sp. RGM 3146]|uniref:aspartyl-phosphate phosphatase Spo0E family protein n=1 Tax=Metabacillus sp. RGM 3146 TaxID=3401092 RepID=UPI003B994665
MVNEIEAKRKSLIETARLYGMNDAATIQCSQELDELLLEQMKQQSKHPLPKNSRRMR